MLTLEQKKMVVVEMFLEESEDTERIMSAIFNEDTRIGRQMIWRVHRFMYWHEMVKRVLEGMTMFERIVYECNRRDAYLQRLEYLGEQEEEIRKTKEQIGEKYVVGAEVVPIPPWATEEFQAQFKHFKKATAKDIVTFGMMDIEDNMEDMRLEEKKEEPRPKYRKKPVDPDWDLYWDDEPILLSVREMKELLDGTKADEPGYPRTIQEMVKELDYVFDSMLQKGEEFKERQERYRRSMHRWREDGQGVGAD